ncbi:MAG: GDSL-type esterase/lipase family protein [Planctomycetota bacterium]
MTPCGCWRRWIVGVALLVGAFGVGSLAEADIARLGAMGDSLTDEYLEQGFGAYADCWTELLVLHRGIDMGPTASDASQPGGTWGEPRRTGYEHNWARFGATTGTMLSQGQHTGLANAVQTQGVTHAAIFIGTNDFSPWFGCYDDVYYGDWDQTDIDNWIAGRISNITTALDTVVPTGVQLVIVNVPDPSIMPYVWSSFPDPFRRDAAAAVEQANAAIRDLAEQYELALVDIYALTKAMFGTNQDQKETLLVGNVEIEVLVASGSNPLAGWVADGIHPRTVVQGVWANVILTAFNEAYGTDVTLFSEEEILVNAGIAYGGQDTLAAQIGSYETYVTVFGHAGDLDGDGDVDSNDFILMAGCLSGPGVSIDPACELGDLDGDADVDLGDFAIFQQRVDS